jgi:hypothetical protein
MPSHPVAMLGIPGTVVPVDGHVHFHRMAWVGPTLDAAARNFGRVVQAGPGVSGVLMLVESPSERIFDRLARAGDVDGWHISPVDAEPESLLATRASEAIVIVCGRQVGCADGLEVLALGTRKRYPQGAALPETLARVRADGHIGVVPWGFLKWRGFRAAQVRELMARSSADALFLGDNGGRMEALDTPRLLRDAAQAGFRVLRGTDPFPFGSDYRRVGAFGFLAGIELDPARPWTGLRGWLQDGRNQPVPYGRALGPFRFACNQGWIQVHNRLLRRPAGW